MTVSWSKTWVALAFAAALVIGLAGCMAKQSAASGSMSRAGGTMQPAGTMSGSDTMKPANAMSGSGTMQPAGAMSGNGATSDASKKSM